MTLKTITQLPKVDFSSDSEKERIINSYLEMSVPTEFDANLYSSKKTLYSDIRDDIEEKTTTQIVNDYGLSSTDGKIQLKDIKDDVKKISDQNFTFNGIKKFSSWPYVDADFPNSEDDFPEYGNEFEYVLPNVKKVKELIDNNSMFMSSTDSLVSEGNPLPHHKTPTAHNAGVPESLDYSNSIGIGKFYFWHIDDQGTDSSTTIYDKDSGSTDGYEEIRDTGNLVVWGWLADNAGNPPTADHCWVALYAKMKCEGYDATQVDVPICVKPWIRGQNASTLQYISFNIPVRKGLRLKIKTGFPVNGQSSGFQSDGSMTFLDGWVPNAFFGYVIK